MVFMARNYHRSPDRKEQKVGFTSLLPSGVLSSVGRGPLRHESRTTGRRLCIVRQVRQLERSVAAAASSLGCGRGTPPSHLHSLSRGSAEVLHGLRRCYAVDGITRKHPSIGAGNVNDELALTLVGVCNGVADTAARLHSRSGRWTFIHRTCVRTNGGRLALVVRPTADAQQ